LSSSSKLGSVFLTGMAQGIGSWLINKLEMSQRDDDGKSVCRGTRGWLRVFTAKRLSGSNTMPAVHHEVRLSSCATISLESTCQLCMTAWLGCRAGASTGAWRRRRNCSSRQTRSSWILPGYATNDCARASESNSCKILGPMMLLSGLQGRAGQNRGIVMLPQ
jgi:hypothetical protein